MDSPKKKNQQLAAKKNGEDREKGTAGSKKYKEKTDSDQNLNNKNHLVRTDKKIVNNFQLKYQEKHQRNNQNFPKR